MHVPFMRKPIRKLSRLHSYDCLRANKAMSAWGVEARVPFLDREFLDVAMSQNPKDKMITKGKMEKQILREAFSDMLPRRNRLASKRTVFRWRGLQLD